ncbi:hypothetical protein DFP73DRAFT_616320 [Morchella snyderi]|nr:hypothetical protein DFP73DRAFT_616320 [Morchella snyderi]
MNNGEHGSGQSQPLDVYVPNRGGIRQWLRDKIICGPSAEPAKKALSKSWGVIICWHFWTFTPCLVTGVLLWLNISNFSIGREIGAARRDPEVTSFVLGVTAVCAKAHEILMVVGLLNIARQAIQRGLTQGGTLLGLVGAEKSLSTVIFISTKEFRTALRYGFSKGPRKLKMEIRKIVALIVVVCTLCTVVGPATYVLMIPRLNWFEDIPLRWNQPEYTIYGSRCCPNILINPQLIYSNLTEEVERGDRIIFETPYPDYNYWQAISTPGFLGNSGEPQLSEGTTDGRESHVHRYTNLDFTVTVNTTWSPGRSLDTRESATKDGTTFSTAWLLDVVSVNVAIDGLYTQRPKHDLAPIRFLADVTGVWSETICRRRSKIESGPSNFSFESVRSGSISGSEVPSSRLILLYDKKNLTNVGAHEDHVNISKIWITEGWVEGGPSDFTNELMVVLQDDKSIDTVIVCSNVVTLKTAKAASSTLRFDATQLSENSGNLDYFPIKSETSNTTERKLLYHKEWLDSINGIREVKSDNDTSASVQYLYPSWTVPPPRETPEPTLNPKLRLWAEAIAQLKWSNTESTEDPTPLELGVGGAFISIISRILPSKTQYTSALNMDPGEDTYTYSFMAGQLPGNLKAEAMIKCEDIQPTLQASHYVYGYQWKTISKILSMVVLLLHSLVAIFGSFWQWRRGGVIKAWGTVAEYGTLCLGTSPERAPLENACAGIKSGTTLQTLVGVRETSGQHGDQTNSKHLELTVISSENEVGDQGDAPKIGNKYGVTSPPVGNKASVSGDKIAASVRLAAISSSLGGDPAEIS